MNSRIHRISKVKRKTNFGENYWTKTRLNLKARFIWEKKKHTITSEISWSNVLKGAGSDSCDNFPGTFVEFPLKIFSQERIANYDYPCPWNYQL